MGKGVQRSFRDVRLWNISVYRFALFFGDLGWQDVTSLYLEQRILPMAG